jgi:hypothetical protein
MSLSDAVRGELRFLLAERGEGDRAIARVWGVTTGLAAAKLDGREEISTDEVDRAARWFGLDPFEFVMSAQRNHRSGPTSL